MGAFVRHSSLKEYCSRVGPPESGVIRPSSGTVPSRRIVGLADSSCRLVRPLGALLGGRIVIENGPSAPRGGDRELFALFGNLDSGNVHEVQLIPARIGEAYRRANPVLRGLLPPMMARRDS